MKKVLAFVLVTLLIGVLVPATLAAGKGGEKGLGARKVDLVDKATGEVVGFVIVNTNAKGVLIVNVQLKSGEVETSYLVYVKQIVADGSSQVQFGEVETDEDGHGHVNVHVPIHKDAEDVVTVKVKLDKVEDSPPNLPWEYVTAERVDAPLKPRK